MIAGAWAMAKGAWSLAGRAMKSVGDWLRTPRDWWRLIAIILAVACLFAAFAVRDARHQVVIVREHCAAQVLAIETEAKAATTTAQANQRALTTCQTQLKAEVGKRQQVEQLGEDAVTAARQDAAAAKKDLADWQRTYRKRPPTCEAALQALEASCPTITDY